jgi:hypothetical protein
VDAGNAMTTDHADYRPLALSVIRGHESGKDTHARSIVASTVTHPSSHGIRNVPVCYLRYNQINKS